MCSTSSSSVCSASQRFLPRPPFRLVRDAVDRPVRVGQGRRGGGPGPEINLPATPVAAPLPTISAEITGPGPIFESLMELKPGDDMAHFKYQAHGIFRLRHSQRPALHHAHRHSPAGRQQSKFSGLVLAESMHPSGNAWMFHFTHRLLDDDGTCRARHPDEHERPVRRVQLRTLQESAGRSGTGGRDPRAGRRADEVEADRGTRWPRFPFGR